MYDIITTVGPNMSEHGNSYERPRDVFTKGLSKALGSANLSLGLANMFYKHGQSA